MPRTPAPLDRQLPRRVVARPRIERRLDALAPGGLALVVASAGSGKSVLVRQWWTRRQHSRLAFLSVDPEHDDAVVLARELVEALRAVLPDLDAGILELVDRGGATLGRAFVDALVAGLGGRGDVVLVLEDLHRLTRRELLDDLGLLLTGLPATARAVVTTRRDPPWPLHRLRVAGWLVEVRGADLAFGRHEAGLLLEAVSGRHLTDDVVAGLVERTDGWAVGLQLAAISLRDADDPEAFVRSFTGSDRVVADYLLEEVVDAQEPAVRRFLLDTSVLSWLSADLCDALTGAGDGREMLRELARRHLFLVPLDRSGETFRYHHLFGDLLQSRLRLEARSDPVELHRRAATWLCHHGFPEDALHHLLLAHERTEALRVVERIGQGLFEQGRSATVAGWLRSIDADAEAAGASAPAAVGVQLLAAQLAADETVAAAETFRRLRRRRDLTLGERTASSALYSLMVFRDAAPEAVLRLGDEVRAAMPDLGPDDVVDFLGIGGRDSVEAIVAFTTGGAHFMSGDLVRAAEALQAALALPGTGYPVWKVYLLGLLALTRAWAGHTTEALWHAHSAIGHARSHGVVHHLATTHAHAAAALAHLDRAELGPARESLARAREQTDRRAGSATYTDLQRTLDARLTAVDSGAEAALTLLEDPSSPVPGAEVLRRAQRSLRARLLLGAGRVGEERAALADRHAGNGPVAAVRVDLALAASDTRSAREALDGWTPAPDDLRDAVAHALRTHLVLEAEGEHRAAGAALADAVALAEAPRLLWPFVEVPDAVRAAGWGARRPPEAGTATVWDLAVRLQPRLRSAEELVEPLTRRELAVLALLPGRLKNAEIAAELYVSGNTLKTHLTSIYRKLGVTERNDAVARARDLGLI